MVDGRMRADYHNTNKKKRRIGVGGKKKKRHVKRRK